MSPLVLILLLILIFFVLGGGGWYMYRGPRYGRNDTLGLVLGIVLVVVILKLLGVF